MTDKIKSTQLVDGGNFPTLDEKAALDAASSPSASNPFITSADGGAISNNINQTIGQLYSCKNNFFLDDTSIRPAGSENLFPIKSLTDVASINSEVNPGFSVKVSDTPKLAGAFLHVSKISTYGISQGIMQFKLWAEVSSATGVTTITPNLMMITDYSTNSSKVATTSGSGTTRTVIASPFSFLNTDANSDPSIASHWLSPKGLYQIVGYTSNSQATISVPSGYVNETNVSYSKLSKITQLSAGEINSTTPKEITFFSDQISQIDGTNGWDTTSSIAILLFLRTTNTTSIVVNYYYQGPTRYSHFEIPELMQIKSCPITVETNATFGTRRSRIVSGTGSFNFNFTIPEDCKKILAAYLICYPSAVAAGPNRSISMTIEYNNYYGESAAQYSASALNVLYDLTNFSGKRFHLDFTNLLNSATSGAEGGIIIDHVSVSGNVDYTSGKIIYI